MRISDGSSDVCSSDLDAAVGVGEPQGQGIVLDQGAELQLVLAQRLLDALQLGDVGAQVDAAAAVDRMGRDLHPAPVLELERHRLALGRLRSEEHTSQLQSLMRTSYAVFCLHKQKLITRRPSLSLSSP